MTTRRRENQGESDFTRQLPQDAGVEKGLIGSLLIDPPEVLKICDEYGVSTESFHIPAHQILFKTIKELWEDNDPCDIIAVTSALRNSGKLAEAGGPSLVSSLFGFVPTAANAAHYCEILAEKYFLREIIRRETKTVTRAFDEQDGLLQIIAEMEENISFFRKLALGKQSHNRNITELLHLCMDDLQASLDGSGKIRMPTGIAALDKKMGGFEAPSMTVIAGKPSDGKTSISLNIAENLCRLGFSVGIISMEMGDVQLVKCLLAAVARVNLRAVKENHKITEAEMHRLGDAMKEIATWKIFIRDDGAMSPSEINATFSDWKAKHGLDFGIIDHAQLCRGEGGTITEQTEFVSRAMKPIAKRHSIPLLVLSQVTEDNHGNFRTKSSRAFEEDADNVWTISHDKEDQFTSFIHISKQRDGERNISIPVTFLPNITRFKDKENEHKK